MTIQIGDHRLTCIGYADSSEADLLGRFLRQGSRALAEAQGEYALVIETDAGDVTVVTSPVGATHYYVLEHDGRLFHSDRVAEILRRSAAEVLRHGDHLVMHREHDCAKATPAHLIAPTPPKTQRTPTSEEVPF
jgi:PAS domain-containing protein